MCLRPLVVKNPNYFDESSAPSHKYANSRNIYGSTMEVPCGKCLECVRRRQNSLAWLCEQEMKRTNTDALFLTLTYNEAHLPYVVGTFEEVDEETGEFITTTKKLPTVCKKQVQNFLKRLRKECDSGLRVFWCTEYGSKFHRPHVHMIIFDCSYMDMYPKVVNCWTTPKKSKYDISEPLGFVYADLAPAGKGALKYIAKYGVKPSGDKSNSLDPLNPISAFEDINCYSANNPEGIIEKPVVRHSIRLGYNYLFDENGHIKQDVITQHHRLQTNSLGHQYCDDRICYGSSSDGRPIFGKLPDVFAKRIFTSQERYDAYRARIEDSFYRDLKKRLDLFNLQHKNDPIYETPESIINKLLQNHCLPEGSSRLFSQPFMAQVADLANQEALDRERALYRLFKREVDKSLF